MSETQRTQAEKIIDDADAMLLKGYDSLTAWRWAVHKLNQLGLNSRDYRYFWQRLDLVTGVK